MNEKIADDKELSTSNLAKEFKLSSQEMFKKLVDFGFITRLNDNWELTPSGKKLGGLYKDLLSISEMGHFLNRTLWHN